MKRSVAVEQFTVGDAVIAFVGFVVTGGLATLLKVWIGKLKVETENRKLDQEATHRQIATLQADIDRLLRRIVSLDEVKIALEERIDEQNREILNLRGKVQALELEREAMEARRATLEARCANLERKNEDLAARLNR